MELLMAFAAGLPAMTQLERLSCCTSPHGFESVTSLLQAAAQCSHLKQMTLHGHCCAHEAEAAADLDKSLAYLVQSNSKLENLNLIIGGKEIRILADKSAFLNALSTNYTLQHLELNLLPYVMHRTPLIMAVKTFTRLNRAGRIYIKTDPNNKFKGIQVLEQVNNNLDCLYCHLREHPSLLCGSPHD
jgi:hypothetical protein